MSKSRGVVIVRECPAICTQSYSWYIFWNYRSFPSIGTVFYSVTVNILITDIAQTVSPALRLGGVRRGRPFFAPPYSQQSAAASDQSLCIANFSDRQANRSGLQLHLG